MSKTVEHPSAESRRLRRRKIKAVLAAGLVLGIGAAATLAAFTDDEYATGTFTAAKFGIEGSVSTAATVPDASYSSHNTSPTAAALDFSSGAFGNLLPNTTVYAPFTIRLDATTTTNGTLTLPGVTSTGTTTGFTYGIKVTATPAACNSTGYTAVVAPALIAVADGTALGATTPATGWSATLVKAAGVGTPVTLCFAVTAGSTVGQSQTATAIWHFQGTAIPVA